MFFHSIKLNLKIKLSKQQVVSLFFHILPLSVVGVRARSFSNVAELIAKKPRDKRQQVRFN
jgi:hypothetical protein